MIAILVLAALLLFFLPFFKVTIFLKIHDFIVIIIRIIGLGITIYGSYLSTSYTYGQIEWLFVPVVIFGLVILVFTQLIHEMHTTIAQNKKEINKLSNK
jgi:hypothetical protein